MWIISNTFTIFPDLFPECSGPLGIEGGIISNQQITASSTHRALFGLQKWYPYYARLNKKGLINAWTAAENDRWPWIQVTHGMGQGDCQGMTRVISERIQVRLFFMVTEDRMIQLSPNWLWNLKLCDICTLTVKCVEG